jgi:hypothetical protein
MKNGLLETGNLKILRMYETITEIQTQNVELKPFVKKARKKWMMKEILGLIDEREIAQQDPRKYRDPNGDIRKAGQEA